MIYLINNTGKSRLKRLVLDSIMRYSIDETIDNVKKRLQVELTYNTMVHTRYLKREVKKDIDKLRQDEFEYQFD